MWTSFIGFMASGKSTVARRLHLATTRPAISLDQMVAEQAGVSVARIFDEQGEAAFRAQELAALSNLAADRPLVVDTGGGIVQTAAAVSLLRERGVVIWLDASWSTVRERLTESDQGTRPLIGQLGWPGLERLFRARRGQYAAAADFRLHSDRISAEDLAQRAMLRSLQWERRHQEARR